MKFAPIRPMAHPPIRHIYSPYSPMHERNIMATPPSDTSHAAAQLQLQLLRQAGAARRVEMAAEMTSFALDSAQLALQRRYPDATMPEIALLLFEQRYGTALATRLREVLLTSGAGNDIVS
jgi:hypothetical protein